MKKRAVMKMIENEHNCVFLSQFNIGFVAASQTSVLCFLPH